MRRVQGFGLALLLTAIAWGGDVSGKWTGGMTLDSGNTMSASLRLKQEGEVIRGTAGPSDDQQFPITTGKMDGERLVIEAKPGPAVLRMSMKLDGNRLVGEVFEDDKKIGTISLQKAE